MREEGLPQRTFYFSPLSRYSFAGFILLGVVLVALIVMFPSWLMQFLPGFHPDIRVGKLLELTFQFTLVTVVGGAVGLWYAVVRDAEARRSERRLQLASLQASIVGTYNSIKLERRKLRRALNELANSIVDESLFDECMLSLEKSQLELEALKRRFELKSDKLLSDSSRKKMRSLMSSMEGVLRPICKEWEFAKNTQNEELKYKKIFDFTFRGGEKVMKELFLPLDCATQVLSDEL